MIECFIVQGCVFVTVLWEGKRKGALYTLFTREKRLRDLRGLIVAERFSSSALITPSRSGQEKEGE